MKRVLNFQKLLLGNCISKREPHDHISNEVKINIATFLILVIPLLVFMQIDTGMQILWMHFLYPTAVLTVSVTRKIELKMQLPVTPDFIIRNYMLLYLSVTVALITICSPIIIIALAVLISVKSDIIYGFGTLLVEYLFEFSVYMIIIVIMLLGRKVRILAAAVFTSAVVLIGFQIHSIAPYMFVTKGNSMVFEYLIYKFGFWPSLAAAAVLAALFAAAGFAILPRLYKRHSMAVA